MSPFMRRMGSCALLGNQNSLTLEMQFFVTIADFVLSLYENWLIARLKRSVEAFEAQTFCNRQKS